VAHLQSPERSILVQSHKQRQLFSGFLFVLLQERAVGDTFYCLFSVTQLLFSEYPGYLHYRLRPCVVNYRFLLFTCPLLTFFFDPPCFCSETFCISCFRCFAYGSAIYGLPPANTGAFRRRRSGMEPAPSMIVFVPMYTRVSFQHPGFLSPLVVIFFLRRLPCSLTGLFPAKKEKLFPFTSCFPPWLLSGSCWTFSPIL